MVAATDPENLRAAWRALSSEQSGDGWKTIPICGEVHWKALAGRQIPGDEEALLIGFPETHAPPATRMPRAQGFGVEVLPSLLPLGGHVWVVLSRRVAGRPELFAAMAWDLIRLLEQSPANDRALLPAKLVARIRAWQEFMDKRPDDVLSAEAELGLFGELAFLERLVAAGMPATAAVLAWEGPRDGLQDFRIGAGAIEVKTSAAAGTFLAVINSLEQLDDCLCNPLFLAAVRVIPDGSGMTLPEMADQVRQVLLDSYTDLDAFEDLLLQAGLLRALVGHYTRRFRVHDVAIHHVTGEFPRLTRANVPAQVRRVRYDLDLGLAAWPQIPLASALTMLEAI